MSFNNSITVNTGLCIAISQVTVAYLIDILYNTLGICERNLDEYVKLQDDSSSTPNSEIAVADQGPKKPLLKNPLPRLAAVVNHIADSP